MPDMFLAKRDREIPRLSLPGRYAEIVPPGVNVLVVDANEVSLVITKAKLCHFGYTVFTARGVVEAASVVEDRSIDVHLVLAETHLPGAEKFEVLDKLGERSDVAVIILTDDEDKDAMLEALKRGAFFYLVKPISTVILTKLWQFALVKKREVYAARLSEGSGVESAAALMEKEPEKKTQGSLNAERIDERKRRHGKKEKDKEGAENDPAESERRQKLVWTLELHKRFLNAMEVLGPNRAHPKGILQQMNIPGLRKEHISSHLQKYRIYLKNMEKLAAERSKSLASSGHLSPASATEVEGAGIISPLLGGAPSSWTVAPVIRGVAPGLVRPSTSSAGVTHLTAIGTQAPMLYKPNCYNQSMLTYNPGLKDESFPFSLGTWMKNGGGITGLPGSFDSGRQTNGSWDGGHTIAATLSTEEKPQLPIQYRQPGHTPGFN